MDFAWLPAQQELYEHVLAYARDTWGDALAEATWTRADWARLGEFGLLGLCIPVEYGGMGLDALTTARCMEALGQGCRDMGLVFSAGAHLFAGCMPLVEHGSEALKRELLPALADGRRVAANAITEAEAGSDVFALRTTAELDGDHYVLNGAKSYVTNGPVADLFLVYTTEDPSHGFMGVSAFAVDRDTPGLRVGAPFETAGLRSSPISPVYLEDCRVPASRMVGGPGRGASVFTGSMLWERSCLFAAYLGAMERQVEATMRHAKERHQFQRPLSKHQAVSHRIVDMVHRLESARLLLYRACWQRDQGQASVMSVSLAKLAVSEAAVQSALDAVQIFGGQGFMSECGIEVGLRDALPATLFSGASEIHRNLVARELGL